MRKQFRTLDKGIFVLCALTFLGATYQVRADGPTTKFNNKNVVFELVNNINSPMAIFQQATVSGTVTDQNGTPLPGANFLKKEQQTAYRQILMVIFLFN